MNAAGNPGLARMGSTPATQHISHKCSPPAVASGERWDDDL
ncbi:MAG: hypothetical protein OJF49_003017 [Ktedonobacterales bacterium]|nr:MAG: hypothetical protein OJF49_003017 [Ktedonobacterales bacterium]